MPHPLAQIVQHFKQLHTSAIVLLALLYDSPPLQRTVRSLAAAVGTSRPSITRACDRLVALGLARRQKDPVDRRSIFIEITAKGRRLLEGSGVPHS